MNNKTKISSTLRVNALWLLVCFGLNFQAMAVQSSEAYTTAKRFNLGGQVTGVIEADPDGTGPLHYPATRNIYNAQGLLIRTETGVLSSWQDETVKPINWSGFSIISTLNLSYNARGLKNRVYVDITGENGQITEFSYDAYDRLQCKAVRMTPDGYYGGNWPTSACALSDQGSNGPDRITKYSYNEIDQPLTEKRAMGTSLEQTYVSYTYDAFNRKVTVTDANNNTTKLSYDSQNRVQYRYFPSKTPGSGVHNVADYEKYGYDFNGNRTSLRKRDGRTINYGYDARNRMTSKVTGYGPTDNVYYSYDLRGLQLTARFNSNNGVGISRTYDGFGRLKTETDSASGTSYTISYQYDDNGNRTRITHPDGKFFTYDYDGLNRLNYIRNNGTPTLSHLSYDNYSRLQSLTTGGNATTSLSYDSLSRVDSTNYQFSGTSNDLVVHFGYNPANQLLDNNLSNDSYLYQERTSNTEAYQINGLNQYTSVGGKSFSHDANANLTSDGNSTYGYDIENRLVSVVGSKNATLKYDPSGRLNQYIIGGVTTHFVYSGDAMVAEYQNGTMIKRYVHGNGSNIPLVEFQGSTTSSYVTRYLHANHQGSIIAASDTYGYVAGINSYDEYGIAGSNNTGRFGYTGQMYLAEIDLYHYRARAYNPRLGRFMQTDPVGYTDQMNLYAYVGNDPVNMIDPSGKIAFKVIKQLIKHRGNLVETIVDVGGDIVTVISPSSTPWDRIEAVISLVSPIDVGDIKKAKSLLEATGKKFAGRKGGIDTRAQNQAIAKNIRKNGGEVNRGFGNKESRFTDGTRGNSGSRYSDGSATDKNGDSFEVQTVDTDAAGKMTSREFDAAMDIAERSKGPVVCIPKQTCL